jgi:nuclear pore complex protein Nup62
MFDEFEEQRTSFQRIAVELGKADRDILANEEAILSLVDRVAVMEAWENELEQSVAFLNAQLNELEALAEVILKELPIAAEAVSPAVMAATGVNAGAVTRLSPADAERDRLFELAESLQLQLSELGGSLASLVSDSNASARPVPGPGPASNLLKVLNGQLESLLYVEQQVDDLRRSKLYTRKLSERAAIQMDRLLFQK